jgi:hypothetical protein
MADKLSLSAAMGHSCEQHFKAAARLKARSHCSQSCPAVIDRALMRRSGL